MPFNDWTVHSHCARQHRIRAVNRARSANGGSAVAADGNHLDRNDAPQFFLEEGAAVVDLTLVLNDKESEIPPQKVQTFLENLALANRALATVAITDAAGKNPGLLSQASAQTCDQAAAAGNYDAAIVAYAAAWALAETAH
ncbi:MAG TPA: hypothetical protein VN841_13995 [Bryobacteraceae bacterium]|nr:hypothetical protein [Bryobacteraceae bacterium]